MSSFAASHPAAGREQSALVAVLACLSAACWSWSLRFEAHAHHAGLGPLFAMWALMTTAMMVPPALPFLLRLLQRRREARHPVLGTAAFLAGYLALWIAFSAAAALLHEALRGRGLLDEGMATNSSHLAAALLLLAGAAQLSPLKRLCLERCRAPSPVHSAAGAAEALAGGARLGALSVASCGALMLVLFVTGVMNAPWMALLTAVLVLESAAPASWRTHQVVGAALLAWGAWTFLG